jgi:hypothetical protein
VGSEGKGARQQSRQGKRHQGKCASKKLHLNPSLKVPLNFRNEPAGSGVLWRRKEHSGDGAILRPEGCFLRQGCPAMSLRCGSKIEDILNWRALFAEGC